MSKTFRIVMITPCFLCLATLATALMAKLEGEQRKILAQEAILSEKICLTGLDEISAAAFKEILNTLATSSRFALLWDKKFQENCQVISDEKLEGFNLIGYLLLYPEVYQKMVIAKNQKKHYKYLLSVLCDSLLREYESPYFFERAKRFASWIGLQEELVVKALKEAIEAVKFDGDLASIEAVLELFTQAKEATLPLSSSAA